MPNESKATYAIVFAAVIVSASLVFLGLSMGGGGGDLDAKIEEGIENYVKKQEEEYMKAQAEANKPKVVEGDFSDDDPFMGNEDAPVTIVEFSDYVCPFCRRHVQQTVPSLKENYIDTGKVKYVFRDLPLSFHDPMATKLAMIGECVQEQLGNVSEVGADVDSVKSCVDSGDFAEEIAADMADAQKAGISGTPGFVVGNQVLSGAQPYESFAAAIEAALE